MWGGALNAAEPRGRAAPAYWAARAQRLRVLRSPGPHIRSTPAPPRPGSPGCLSLSEAGHCRPSAPRSAKAHLCLRINVTSCLASPSHRLRSVQRSALLVGLWVRVHLRIRTEAAQGQRGHRHAHGDGPSEAPSTRADGRRGWRDHPRGDSPRGSAGPSAAPATPGGQRERVRPRIRFLLLQPPVPSDVSVNAPLRASGGFRGLGQPPPACLSPDGAAAPTPGPLHAPSSPRSLPVLPRSPERRRPRAAGPSGASGDTDCLSGAGTRALRCAGDPTWGQSW